MLNTNFLYFFGAFLTVIQMQDGGDKRIVAAEQLHGLEQLDEDNGLLCMICREGYSFKRDDILGIYTFRCAFAGSAVLLGLGRRSCD